MKYASLGSISHGTMRNEDLLFSFADELEYHLKRQPRSFKRAAYRKLINEARRYLGSETEFYHRASTTHTLAADDCVYALFDTLDEFAPPYAYFGANEGDGSDYGFWPAIDNFDGLRVADISEIPADYRGEVLHVNDHGNATLYVQTARNKLREIWSIV